MKYADVVNMGKPLKGTAMGPRKFTLLIALATPTLAWAAAPSPAVRRACHDDAVRFCSAVIWQAEARRACMRRHHAQLSMRCKAAIADQMLTTGAQKGR